MASFRQVAFAQWLLRMNNFEFRVGWIADVMSEKQLSLAFD
jgi:hypothetical protein